MADPSAAMPPLAVLTRPSGRNEALAARLRAHGWEACVLPALEILPLDCLEGCPCRKTTTWWSSSAATRRACTWTS